MYFSRCGFCDIPYKVIAKAESFAEDREYIGRIANVTFTTIGKDIKVWTIKLLTEF